MRQTLAVLIGFFVLFAGAMIPLGLWAVDLGKPLHGLVIILHSPVALWMAGKADYLRRRC